MMKEYPTIYVLSSYDYGVYYAYYEEEEAKKAAQEFMAEQFLDARDWECYFRIDRTQVR